MMPQNTKKVMFAGRGRGRLVPQEVLDAPLRKPGLQLSENNTSSIDKLARLDILFTGLLEDLIVYRVLENYIFGDKYNDLDLERMMEYIFENIMKDSSNATLICKYLYVMFRHNEHGAAILNCFYKYLQKYYKDHSSIKLKSGAVEYRNFVALFAAATHHARNINVPPFDELIDAILELALKLVPSQVQEDIKIFSLCVIRYSQYLKMTQVSGSPNSMLEKRQKCLEDAKSVARKMCLNGDITKISLAWLLLVMDCNSFTEDALNEYSPPLDASSLKLLKKDILLTKLPRKDLHKYSLDHVKPILELV